MYTDDELLYQIHSHADQTCDSLENIMNLSGIKETHRRCRSGERGIVMMYTRNSCTRFTHKKIVLKVVGNIL